MFDHNIYIIVLPLRPRLNDPDGRKAQSWKIFLHNHKDVILAMDFFTVPTVAFKIQFNQRHLQKLMKEYIDYYNDDRCHLAIGRDSPSGREIQNKPKKSKVKSIPKLGGLVHRYEWKKFA